MNNKNVLCPICSSQAQMKLELPVKFITNKLKEHFNAEFSGDLDIIDYSLMECVTCNFEFAFPLVEGSSKFYNWVTAQSTYYPNERWEYSKAIEIAKADSKNLKLVDIGCGDGNFLDFANTLTKNIEYFGLDTTKNSVDICLKKNHNVHCMNVLEFKMKFPNDHFDIITAFHVLEHIANPLDFINELLGLLNKDGFILLSTPYSPMNFELNWFDILNHPPHHMGRWSLSSYQKVSEVLDLDMEVFMPQSQSFIVSAFNSFIFSIYGNSRGIGKINVIKNALIHPIMFFEHLLRQYKRERVNNKRAANVILVKLSPRNLTSN